MALRLLLLLFIVSCSSTESLRGGNGANLENAYISNGLEQFFLGDLPYWANFSTPGKCHRTSNIRFLHFENLNKSYNLTYAQAVHLQHMLNRKLYAYKASSAGSSLQPKDESYIFYNVYQQVVGERYDFIQPKYKKVSVVLVDPFLSEPKKLVKTIKSKKVLAGHPVLLSQCLNSYELEELARSLGLDELGVKYLSSDMLNIYNTELESRSFFSLNITELLADKEVTVFGKKRLENIQGQYKFIPIP